MNINMTWELAIAARAALLDSRDRYTPNSKNWTRYNDAHKAVADAMHLAIGFCEQDLPMLLANQAG